MGAYGVGSALLMQAYNVFILEISAAAVQSVKQGYHCQTKKIQEAANKKIDFIWGFKNLGGTDTSNLKRCSK